MICLGLVTCLFCAWLGVQAAYPYAKAAEWRAQNDADEREWRRLRLANQRSEKEIKGLSTPAGIERQARRLLGYTRPNERRLHLPPN